MNPQQTRRLKKRKYQNRLRKRREAHFARTHYPGPPDLKEIAREHQERHERTIKNSIKDLQDHFSYT